MKDFLQGPAIKIILIVLLVGMILFAALAYFSVTIPFINQRLCLPASIPLLGGRCDTQPPQEEVTLTYWGLWEPAQVMQPLIEDFQAQNPKVKIQYQKRDFKDHFETVQSRLQTQLAPDIIRVHNTWVPYLSDYLSAIPTSIMDAETFQRTFYPVTKDTLYVDGKYLAIPLEVDGLVLLYNKVLFSQSDVRQPPETWDAFKETVDQLTKKDEKNNIIQGGVALGYSSIEHFSDFLGLMMAQREVSFVDQKGQVAFNTSYSQLGENLGAEVLDFYHTFASTRNSWNPAWGSAITSFAQGKVAMFFAPSYRIFDILAQNPNLPLGVARVPQLTTDANKEVAWGTFWVEVVPANSPHRLEAWQFLKFLSEKENLNKMYRLASNLRPFGEPYSRRDMAGELINHQYLRPIIEQAPNYASWTLADSTSDEFLNDKIIEIFADAVDRVNAGEESESALDTAATEVQKILDGFGD